MLHSGEPGRLEVDCLRNSLKTAISRLQCHKITGRTANPVGNVSCSKIHLSYNTEADSMLHHTAFQLFTLPSPNCSIPDGCRTRHRHRPQAPKSKGPPTLRGLGNRSLDQNDMAGMHQREPGLYELAAGNGLKEKCSGGNRRARCGEVEITGRAVRREG